MITKYRTESVRYGVTAKIDPIEFERETDKMLFFSGGGRVAKQSSWETYHDSWEEAHAYLLEAAETRVTAARLALEQAKGRLGNVKGMKKPEGR